MKMKRILVAGVWEGSYTTSLLHRYDMQVVNYGASATVNVYFDGVLVISYTGDVTVTGVTNLDQMWGFWPSSNAYYFSEGFVSSDDSRSYWGIYNLALTGSGTTDQWTGVYSTINALTLSDASPNYTNTSSQDQQFNITDVTVILVSVAAVKIAARAAKSSSSTPTKIALGYNDGGSVAVGTAQTVTGAYNTY